MTDYGFTVTSNDPAVITNSSVLRDRIMIDTATPAAAIAAVRDRKTFHGLPISLVALYVDGRYAATPADWQALVDLGIQRECLVGITVLGGGGEALRAQAADEEPGNMDPAGAAAWAKDEHDAGHWPVVYSDRSDKPHVIEQCRARGLRLGVDYGLWTATLDGTFTDIDGSDLRTQEGMVAVQWLGAAAAGINADVSLVVRDSWRAPRPAPEPEPAAYVVIRLPDGAASKMLSGMTLH